MFLLGMAPESSLLHAEPDAPRGAVSGYWQRHNSEDALSSARPDHLAVTSSRKGCGSSE